MLNRNRNDHMHQIAHTTHHKHSTPHTITLPPPTTHVYKDAEPLPLTNMPTRSSLHQWGVTILVLMLNVCCRLEQDPHNVFIAPTTCIGQCCVANTERKQNNNNNKLNRHEVRQTTASDREQFYDVLYFNPLSHSLQKAKHTLVCSCVTGNCLDPTIRELFNTRWTFNGHTCSYLDFALTLAPWSMRSFTMSA